jgi:hypothetical protein
MSVEGDCREVEVTPNLELLVTLGVSLERVCPGASFTKLTCISDVTFGNFLL